jgi:hypothetical protein
MKKKRCVFLLLTFRPTNASSGMRECGEPAEWVRRWNGGERHYCDDHKKLLTAMPGNWARYGEDKYIAPIKLIAKTFGVSARTVYNWKRDRGSE